MKVSPYNKYRVGVLRGGPSKEYNHSLSSGAHVLRHMPEGFEGHDIWIDKKGRWHYRGLEIEPQKALGVHDIIFNALHGEYGEDGQLHEYLDRHALRYTGSKSAGARLSYNKFASKQFFDQYDIKIPRYTVINLGEYDAHELALQVFRMFPVPLVIKPVSGGASYGVEVIRDFKKLVDSLLRRRGQHVILEEYIEGMPVSAGVVEDFRGEKIYPLIPVHIVLPQGSSLLDYSQKGEFSYSTLGRVDSELVDTVMDTAQKAHDILGLHGYSRSDFIVSPQRGVYLLEANALPDVSHDSPFVYALEQSGITMRDFLESTLRNALEHTW